MVLWGVAITGIALAALGLALCAAYVFIKVLFT